MSLDPNSTLVTVTGASGFIGMHCVLQLLEAGYQVRGTLRVPSRRDSIRATLAKHVDTARLVGPKRARLVRSGQFVAS